MAYSPGELITSGLGLSALMFAIGLIGGLDVALRIGRATFLSAGMLMIFFSVVAVHQL